VFKKLGLAGIKFEDMDLDGSGEITLEEMMTVVIQNIKTLEINSEDLKFEDQDYLNDSKHSENIENVSTIHKNDNLNISS